MLEYKSASLDHPSHERPVGTSSKLPMINFCGGPGGSGKRLCWGLEERWDISRESKTKVSKPRKASVMIKEPESIEAVVGPVEVSMKGVSGW